MRFKVGKDVRVGEAIGTVVAIRRYKIRVLFPVRRFAWVPKADAVRLLPSWEPIKALAEAGRRLGRRARR